MKNLQLETVTAFALETNELQVRQAVADITQHSSRI
jgi:hypothetical protein